MLNNYKQIKILNINEFAVYSKKRNCYSKIADFINASNSTNKKICIIYERKNNTTAASSARNYC